MEHGVYYCCLFGNV